MYFVQRSFDSSRCLHCVQVWHVIVLLILRFFCENCFQTVVIVVDLVANERQILLSTDRSVVLPILSSKHLTLQIDGQICTRVGTATTIRSEIKNIILRNVRNSDVYIYAITNRVFLHTGYVIIIQPKLILLFQQLR